jgi:hypothetical protein
MLPEYDLASIYPNANCLSSSQFLKYEENPEAFWLEYVIGSKNKATQPMDLGRIFAASYADRTLDFRTLLTERGYKVEFIDLFETVLKRFPVLKGGQPELPMICEFKNWKFRATLDDYVEKELVIIENKTGKMWWSQRRADESDQVTFQNWCHWKLTGKLSKYTLLNWWNTGKKTPEIKTFKTRRTLSQLKEFEKRVEAVIEHLEAGNFSNPIYC